MLRHLSWLLAVGILHTLGTPRCPAAVRYVNVNASSAGADGSSWSLAFYSLQDAIDAAQPGDEVWVAAGEYYEAVTLKDGVSLYGGFTGAESSRSQRNAAPNVTVIDGSRAGAAVTATSFDNLAVVDGFTIRNGIGYLDFNGSRRGGGIYCFYAKVRIENNVIQGNEATFGGAIFCEGTATVISGNLIQGNTGLLGIVDCALNAALIERNMITANSTSAALMCYSSSPTIRDNVVAGNGGGIDCLSNSPARITNNTVVDNAQTGIVMPADGSFTVMNNLVAFNGSGISYSVSNPQPYHIGYNCLYGNGATVGPSVAGDVLSDPKLVNRGGHNYRILISSPCVDAGNDAVVAAAEVDYAGSPRLQARHVDIGAYEFPAVATPSITSQGDVSASPVEVMIDDTTPGSLLHYTTSGDPPTAADPVLLPGATITVGQSALLKVKGFKDGLLPSNVSSVAFKIGPKWVDAFRALRIWAGLVQATAEDSIGLNVEGQGGNNSIEYVDVLRLVRQASGIDPVH